jgi:hypothetical protein
VVPGRLASLAVAVLLAITAHDAVAGTKEVIELHVDAATGAPLAAADKACIRRSDGTTPDNNDQLTLVVMGGALSVDLELSLGTAQHDWIAGTPIPTMAPGAYAAEDLVIKKKSDATVICIAKATAKATAKPTADPRALETGTMNTTPLNQAAIAAMDGELRISRHGTPNGADRYFGGSYVLYHLPDGSPAFPIPRHIAEKDDLQIVVVLPVGASAKVDVLACDQVPAVRVEGSLKAATEAAGQLHGDETPRFVVKSYPFKLACTGTLTYRIQTSGAGAAGNTTTSIAIDPVYRFHWGAGAMFDFGTPHVLSLQNRPAASGMGSEKFVNDAANRSGLKPIITLSASICRTNPKDFTACDVFVPVAWIDPTRPTRGFGWGVGIRPGNYVTVIVGMTVFETQRLLPGVTAPVGSTWTAAGDLPTESIYTKGSIGLALGLSLDTDVFAKVFTKN